MADLDAATIAQNAQRIGLVNEAQLQEVWEEIGKRTTDPDVLLRCLERKGYVTPLMSSKLMKGDEEGYILGGYRLLYKIASGSFGRVYRADDPRSGRIVAVKVLRRRWSEDQQRIDLFMREGKVGMSLHHPNIVEIIAVNRESATGQYYIVMEFVEGGNLRELLAIRNKLEASEAIKLLEDMTAGLAHAYSRGLTHRDIKLTNILVSSQGTAKLVDFGLAKIFGSAPLMKGEEDRVERTVDYAGLEKATNVKSGDVRSDIYFLGCVTYEMLTGRAPLNMTRDRHARMARNRFLEAQPMTRDDVKAPPAVFHLVETMMALQPQQRYQTPAQLLEAVKSVRRELGAKHDGAAARSGPQAIFVVEADGRLQDPIRDKFKELGYRVFLAIDPARAIDRFRQQPYDGLVIDVGTVGEDGLLVFERIMAEAARQGFPCAGIAMLSEEQADWVRRITARPNVAVLVRPITLKQLHRKLQELMTPAS